MRPAMRDRAGSFSSSTRARIEALFKAVIQPIPPWSRRVAIAALLIMPRSPTITNWRIPKSSLRRVISGIKKADHNKNDFAFMTRDNFNSKRNPPIRPLIARGSGQTLPVSSGWRVRRRPA